LLLPTCVFPVIYDWKLSCMGNAWVRRVGALSSFSFFYNTRSQAALNLRSLDFGSCVVNIQVNVATCQHYFSILWRKYRQVPRIFPYMHHLYNSHQLVVFLLKILKILWNMWARRSAKNNATWNCPYPIFVKSLLYLIWEPNSVLRNNLWIW
jgi:hypothetical protein